MLAVDNVKDILKVMFPQKSEDRMGVLNQALFEASSGGNVAYKNLFADEAETKYEALVHCIKSQYVRERVEYWKSLEKNLYAEANHRDNCTKGQLSSALALNDGFLSAKAIDRIVAPFFTASDSREMPIRDVLEALNQASVPSLMRAEDVMSTSRRAPSPDMMDTSGRHRSASFL
ncbi:hypothetical protein CYMTET_25527 [Cymbomonas tetramitiformis]|uniref:Uncharacterized protein n=1 Tax=Cymbomonas tetramitiformis TaxID=36881 RepID=A0AAE0KZ56_9CHLO|nr:hypothetical protein CYMTET_25527 [Cymbomonas tetramitiformis]